MPTTETQICEQHHIEMIPGESFTVFDRPYVGRPSCPMCMAAEQEKAKEAAAGHAADEFRRLQDRADIPRRYRTASLAGIIAETPAQKDILEVATRFAKSFGQTPSGLMLIGTLGSGKTYLGCVLANAFLKAGRLAMYSTALGVIRKLRSRWGSREQTEEQLFQKLVQMNLLIVDEIGVQFGTASEQAILTNLIDARYAEQHPTILIGNLTMAELTSTLGERIIDRFKQGGRVLVFDWPSRRAMMGNESLEDDHASRSAAPVHLRVSV